MADVTGTIGNAAVELNNAATEATLKLLLQSSLAANKQSMASIQKLAQQSGINPASVAAANQGMQKAGSSGTKLSTGFEALGFAAGSVSKAFNEAVDLTKKLASGSAEASDVFGSFAKIGGVTGAVFGGMQKLAEAQEKYLKTYQELSNSGINFSGSLSQMRMAAASTYMTLDGFATLMKNNSQAFTKMGGTADEGAQAFVKVANKMQKSEIGDQLRALGYTSEQANEGLASYIAMTGGRNKTEMQNTQRLAAAAGEYLTQLDELAQVTGKSREEQEKALKEAAQNSAMQNMLAGMDEKQKAAYQKGLAEMTAKFGKAGIEMYQAQMLGIPPQTEAAKNLTALAPEVAKASQGMADVAKRGGTAAETLKYSAQATEGAIKASKNFGDGVNASMSFASGGIADAVNSLGQANARATQQGIKTAEDELAQRNSIQAKQKERMESEAAAAAEAKKALNELGQAIINRLMPIFAELIGFVNKVTIGFADFAKYLLNSPILLTGLMVAIGGITAAFVTLKVATAAATAVENAKKLAAGFGKGGGVKGALAGLGPLGSKGNPMYVIALGGGLGGGPGGKGGPGKPGGKGPGNLAKTAGKFAKVGGVVGGLVSAASLYGDLGDISDKQKSGELSKEEAKKAKGGAVGEAGGGLAGAAAGAAAGALLGSVVPVLGTAIGGLIGGAIGGFGGGELGKMAGEWIGGSSKKTESAPAPEIKEGPMPKPVEFESQTKTLQTDVQALNTTMREVLKYVRETADYTKRTVDATRALNGNLYPTI
jgi:hypothetical protein